MARSPRSSPRSCRSPAESSTPMNVRRCIAPITGRIAATSAGVRTRGQSRVAVTDTIGDVRAGVMKDMIVVVQVEKRSEVGEEPDDVGEVDPAVLVVVERGERLVRRDP